MVLNKRLPGFLEFNLLNMFKFYYCTALMETLRIINWVSDLVIAKGRLVSFHLAYVRGGAEIT